MSFRSFRTEASLRRLDVGGAGLPWQCMDTESHHTNTDSVAAARWPGFRSPR